LTEISIVLVAKLDAAYTVA